MKRYKYRVEMAIIQYTVVEVDAETEDKAKRFALAGRGYEFPTTYTEAEIGEVQILHEVRG
jgi:hypothetical protein